VGGGGEERHEGWGEERHEKLWGDAWEAGGGRRSAGGEGSKARRTTAGPAAAYFPAMRATFLVPGVAACTAPPPPPPPLHATHPAPGVAACPSPPPPVRSGPPGAARRTAGRSRHSPAWARDIMGEGGGSVRGIQAAAPQAANLPSPHHLATGVHLQRHARLAGAGERGVAGPGSAGPGTPAIAGAQARRPAAAHLSQQRGGGRLVFGLDSASRCPTSRLDPFGSSAQLHAAHAACRRQEKINLSSC